MRYDYTELIVQICTQRVMTKTFILKVINQRNFVIFFFLVEMSLCKAQLFCWKISKFQFCWICFVHHSSFFLGVRAWSSHFSPINKPKSSDP